jgi:hypothetical protein
MRQLLNLMTTHQSLSSQFVKRGTCFFEMPLDPWLSNFSAHLKFLPSGSLGNRSAEISSEIATELRENNFNVLAVATDGDRACLKRHDLLYDRYYHENFSLMDELIHVIDDTEIWEIADSLHPFKCQRCKLVHRLSFIRVEKPFTARSLNSILGLEPPLEPLTGIYCMNDVLAITLFTIENCLKLLFAGKLSGFYYLLPFSIWFAAIHDPTISLRCRQQMIELCFQCFADWIA